jgi:hypothetical protein
MSILAHRRKAFRGEADPYFSSVELLLHCDGADASTTFTDHSANGYTVTATGNAQIDTAQSKFGGASCLLDGTGDYLSIADAAPLQMGSGDFTIECWVRFNSLAGSFTIFGKSVYATGGIDLISDGTSLYFDMQTTRGSVTLASLALSTGTWYHFACVRSGSSCVLYIDGVSKATLTSSANINSAVAFNIGSAAPNYSGFDLNGWIDDFRVTKGVARYTSAFTPPTAAFPNY